MIDKITKLDRTARLTFGVSKCCGVSPELYERVYQHEESLYWVKCPKCNLEGDNETYKIRAYMNWERKLITKQQQDIIRSLEAKLEDANLKLELRQAAYDMDNRLGKENEELQTKLTEQDKLLEVMAEHLEASLELHEESLQLDFRANNIHGSEDVVVEAICERFGYGAVMDSAARLWHLKDVSMGLTDHKITGTGFTTGHNYSVIKSMYDKAKQALAQYQSYKGWE